MNENCYNCKYYENEDTYPGTGWHDKSNGKTNNTKLGGQQMAVKQELQFELQPMDGTVTISIDDYNTLLEERELLINQMRAMERNRIDELKQIFQLVPNYSTVELHVHAGKIVEELYGTQVTFGDKHYEKAPDSELSANIYQAYNQI